MDGATVGMIHGLLRARTDLAAAEMLSPLRRFCLMREKADFELKLVRSGAPSSQNVQLAQCPANGTASAALYERGKGSVGEIRGLDRKTAAIVTNHLEAWRLADGNIFGFHHRAPDQQAMIVAR
jgi:hypothetical protein